MDATAFQQAAAVGATLVAEPFTLECGAQSEVAAGPEATWILFSGDYDRSVRLTVDSDLGPLPAMTVIVIANRSSPVTLGCSGVAEMTILQVVSAPLTAGVQADGNAGPAAGSIKSRRHFMQ
jgi:hypothetical protein